MTLTATQTVTNDYNDILFDSANNAAGIAQSAGLLTASPSQASAVANSIAALSEASIVNYVNALYATVLVDPLSNTTAAGLRYWVQQTEAIPSLNMTAANIAAGQLSAVATSFLDQSFINSAGTNLLAPAAAPTVATATVLVDQLYAQALGVTTPVQVGVTYWANQYIAWYSQNGATQALQSLVGSFANVASASSNATVSAWLSAAALTDIGSGANYSPSSAGSGTYALTNGGATSATEGSTVTFLVATTNVSAGSSLTYTLSGVTASEVVGGLLTGTVAVAADGTANIPVTLTSTAGQGLSGNLTATLTVPSNASSSSVTSASVALTETAAGPTLVIATGTSASITQTTAVTGGVTIGNTAGVSEPTGAITITDNAVTGAVNIYGGAGVTVTTFSTGGVTIGNQTTATDPTGAVTVNDNALTGVVAVFGGAGVTVTTASTAGATVGTVAGTSEPSGAVTITDTATTGAVDVNGGAAVSITTASIGNVTVGVSGIIAADPNGNVTVTNLNGTAFGTAALAVFTNGGNTVTVTGTSGGTITDASATHLLATVTLDGVGGATTITTGNPLVSLSVLDGASTSSETVVGSAGHVLALTVGSVTLASAYANVTDSTAASITVTTTPTTAVEHLSLSAAAATAIVLGAHTAGTDSIRVGTIATTHAATGAMITGAAVGDFLQFADTATSVVAGGTAAGASLGAAAAIMDALASTVAHSATVFTFVGNTYVLESVAAGTGTLQAGDSLVELVGTHTLSAPAAGVFHLLT